MTPTEFTIYTRDRLLSVRSNAAVLSPDTCLFISHLGLRRRGCRGGSHKRRQLEASRGVTSWGMPRESPANQLIRGSEPCQLGEGDVTELPTNIPVILTDPCLRKHRIKRRLPVLKQIKLNDTDSSSSLLRCYVINARSLQKNNAVQLLATELNAIEGDVAAVTETWLSNKVNSDHISIPGYNFFRQDRQRRKGGGVGAYVRDSLTTELLHTPNHDSGIQDSHEVLCLKICKCSVLYVMLIVYHPPKPVYNSQDLITRLTDDIDYVSCNFPQAILFLTGDFNRLDLNTFLADTGLIMIDVGPTRGRHELDRFITNSPDFSSCTVVKACLNTDHHALLVNCNPPPGADSKKTRRVITFPDIRQHNLLQLSEVLQQQDWTDITRESDIDIAYSCFVEKLTTLVHSVIPFRRVTVTNSTPTYVTPLVRSLLRRRNKLMRRGKIDTAGELSAKIGRLIAEHREHELRDVNYKDTKKLWSKVRAAPVPARAATLGSKYGSQFDDLDALNTHFANIATDPDYDIDYINAIIDSVHDNGLITRPVYDYEIYRLLSAVKRTAPGSDNIPYWVFKHCAVELSGVIANLVNKTLSSGRPPLAWKNALVTPIPKVQSVKTFSELRPISVTPILSRLVEKLIVRKYIIPALPLDSISDQFAYRPTGSTTAALVSLTHTVAQKLEACTYVRCLLIDYTKAFDMINHSILFSKIGCLSIPSDIQRWLFHFFTGRRQAVVSGGGQSRWLPITRSIVQGSGVGPSAYLVYSADLKLLSEYNSIIKFADDTTLLVPQCSSVSLEEEFQHVQRWSQINKLQINISKTKELVFRRPSARHFTVPQPLPFVEQVTVTKLLGILISATFSVAAHVEHILSVGNQRMFLLAQLKNQGLSRNALHIIFNAIVSSVITYALPSFAGQLSKGDKARIDSLFRKAFRRGFCCEIITIDELISAADKKLFRQLSNDSHCLHPLLPKQRNNKLHSLRNRGHNYILPRIETALFKNSFLNRCLFSYV